MDKKALNNLETLSHVRMMKIVYRNIQIKWVLRIDWSETIVIKDWKMDGNVSQEFQFCESV